MFKELSALKLVIVMAALLVNIFEVVVDIVLKKFFPLFGHMAYCSMYLLVSRVL